MRGCLRLLPTEGPYMLKDSFAELLQGEQAPQHARIWELSRFTIETDAASRFGFSEITMDLFGDLIHYGRRNGIDRFISVTTTGFERLLRRAGVVTTRIGKPVQIGIEMAVALYVEVEPTYHAVYEHRLAS